MSRWNEGNVKLLKTLWARGLSNKVIAERIGGGVTPSAVGTKAHHLGLPARTQVAGVDSKRRKVAFPTSLPITPSHALPRNHCRYDDDPMYREVAAPGLTRPPFTHSNKRKLDKP